MTSYIVASNGSFTCMVRAESAEIAESAAKALAMEKGYMEFNEDMDFTAYTVDEYLDNEDPMEIEIHW